MEHSEYAKRCKYESILNTLSDLYCVKADPYKEEFYSLVKKMED